MPRKILHLIQFDLYLKPSFAVTKIKAFTSQLTFFNYKKKYKFYILDSFISECPPTPPLLMTNPGSVIEFLGVGGGIGTPEGDGKLERLGQEAGEGYCSQQGEECRIGPTVFEWREHSEEGWEGSVVDTYVDWELILYSGKCSGVFTVAFTGGGSQELGKEVEERKGKAQMFIGAGKIR